MATRSPNRARKAAATAGVSEISGTITRTVRPAAMVRVGQPDVDLRLAAAGDAVDQRHVKGPGVEPRRERVEAPWTAPRVSSPTGGAASPPVRPHGPVNGSRSIALRAGGRPVPAAPASGCRSGRGPSRAGGRAQSRAAPRRAPPPVRAAAVPSESSARRAASACATSCPCAVSSSTRSVL